MSAAAALTARIAAGCCQTTLADAVAMLAGLRNWDKLCEGFCAKVYNSWNLSAKVRTLRVETRLLEH